jgi:3-oxoadipate enol-lactonase
VKPTSFCSSGDARIHYLLEGPAGAPVLVFSNSLGTNYSMWDSQSREFQKEFRVLCYDMRGHGQSSVTPGPYSIEQLGRDVIALLDALRLDRVHFCGLSMGGMIGMWLGVNAPERLNKLAVCNCAAKIATPEIWNARIEAVRTGGMKSIASAVIERWFSPGFRAKDAATVASIQRMLEAANVEGYAACCAAVRDFEFRTKLGNIPVPTLVITGAYDSGAPPADGHFLAERIPGARYAELNAAHLSNIEDRERFTKEVRAFLSHRTGSSALG